MDFGARLKKLRLEQGLTQEGVAEPDYSAAYVSTIEAGKRMPSRRAVEHFAANLQVDPDELITGRNPGRRAELLVAYGDARRRLSSGAVGAIDVARTAFTRLEREAKRDGFLDVQAKAVIGRGLCAEATNDLDAAVEIYEYALELLADETPVTRIDALVGKVRVLHARGEIAYAAFLCEKALAELKALGIEDPSALLRLYSSLVAAYFDAGLIEKASEASERAHELAIHVDDPDRLANMYLNAGIMLAQQGHWREAESRLEEAERFFEEAHFTLDLARVRLVRGINLRNQQRFDEARPHILAARDAFVAAGNKLREARATLALGLLERLAGNADEAQLLLRRAIALAGEDRAVAGMAQREFALCASDETKVLAGLREAITILEGAGIAKELATTYRALGDVLSRDEELKGACDAYRKAADLFEQAA